MSSIVRRYNTIARNAFFSGQTNVIALVQHAATFGAPPLSVTLTNSPTAGNMIIAGAATSNFDPVISDGTNTYQTTPGGIRSSAIDGTRMGVFYHQVGPAGGGGTVGLSSSSVSATFFVAEFRNIATVGLDAFGEANTNTINFPTLTTVNDRALVFAVTQSDNAINGVFPPWLLIDTESGDVDAYAVQQQAGSITGNFTTALAPGNDHCLLASFYP